MNALDPEILERVKRLEQEVRETHRLIEKVVRLLTQSTAVTYQRPVGLIANPD